MKNRKVLVYLLVGVLAASVLGITTDQILQNVYDSSNTALRANIVAGGGGGGGFVTGTGTSGDLAAYTGTTTIANYAGTSCGAGTGLSALSAAGAATCTSFAQGGGSTASPLAIVLPNSGSTGTTTNKLAKINTDGTVVITATTDTVGAIGPVLSGAGTTGSATILLIGSASCVFDNATTAGDYVTISSSTAGDCHDAGSTYPSLTSVLGVVTQTNGSPGTNTVIFDTPDIMNTSNQKGGNPGKGNITNLVYTGTLSIQDVHTNSTSFTVGHRIELASGGSGNYTATMPASPTVGDTYSVINLDTAHTVIITRAGSQTLNGATTLTLAAYTAPTRQDEHCIYIASNNWVCEGPAT